MKTVYKMLLAIALSFAQVIAPSLTGRAGGGSLLFAQTIGEAFYIYRNDGGFNAFFREEVDSMAYSFYDADSVLCDDAVSQVIYTQDSTYVIPLAAIDSVNFVTPETKYQPGVIEIKGELRDYILSSKDMTITFASNTPVSCLPQVGDKIVTLEMSDIFPIGFAGKVRRISSSDNYIVECDTVDLSTIFERYFSSASIDLQASPDNKDSKTKIRHSRQDNPFNEDIYIPPFSGNFDFSGSVYLTENVPFSLGASIGTTITPSCHVNCTFIVDATVGTYFNATIVTDIETKEDISVSGDVSISRDFPIGIPFNYPIGIPLVNFYAEAGVFLDGSLSLCWSSSLAQIYRHYLFRDCRLIISTAIALSPV